jgi:hypothetical protein
MAFYTKFVSKTLSKWYLRASEPISLQSSSHFLGVLHNVLCLSAPFLFRIRQPASPEVIVVAHCCKNGIDSLIFPSLSSLLLRQQHRFT